MQVFWPTLALGSITWEFRAEPENPRNGSFDRKERAIRSVRRETGLTGKVTHFFAYWGIGTALLHGSRESDACVPIADGA